MKILLASSLSNFFSKWRQKAGTVKSRLKEENRLLQEQMVLKHQDIKNKEVEKGILTQQLTLLQNEKLLAVTEAEKSKLQLARADQDNSDMKEQIKELQNKIELLTQGKFEAEKKAAVAEAQCEQYRKQKNK